MDNLKDDSYYTGRIITDLAFITQHMENVDFDRFSGDDILQDAMMFRLIQISENARKLSDEYKEHNGAVPWTAITGLRNRIVHDYGNVDLRVVFDTLKEDIPSLMSIMKTELRKD